MAVVVKNPPADAGDVRDVGSIPVSGGYPEEGNGNPLQYSCLENSMDRGAWWVMGSQRVRHNWVTYTNTRNSVESALPMVADPIEMETILLKFYMSACL